MDAQPVSIDVGKGFQEGYAAELVAHFLNAQFAEGALFKSCATMFGASVVEGEHDIATLCHVDVPASCTVVVAGINHVGMGAAIDVCDGGIFLLRVKAYGKNQPVVKVGDTVGSLDDSCTYFGNRISALHPFVFCRKEVTGLPGGKVDEIDAPGAGRGGVVVNEEASRLGDGRVGMPAFQVAEWGAFS